MKTSTESSRSSAWTGWALGLLAAPLVYVLTFAPLAMLVANPWAQSPRWLVVYGAPMSWIVKHTPLAGPLQAYAEWWLKMLHGPGRP